MKPYDSKDHPVGAATRALGRAGGPFWLPGSPRLRRATLGLMDAVLIAGGLALNFELWLRFRHGRIPEQYVSLFLHVVVPIILIRVGMFALFGLYRSMGARAGARELLLIAAANTLATAIITALNFSLPLIPRLGTFPLGGAGGGLLRLPWGVVFSDWTLSILTISGVRLLRAEVARRVPLMAAAEGARRALIIGAGPTGERVAADLAASTGGRFRPVAFVDDNPALRGNTIEGLPVAGPIAELEAIMAKWRVDEIVIALERAAPREVSEIVERCRRARLEFKIVPPLTGLITGGVTVNALRPVEIEDLLGRAAIRLDSEAGGAWLRGKTVLITGAGGSIGRELWRQVMAQRPAKVIALGRGENSLFEALAEHEAPAREAGVALAPVIGETRDAGLIQNLFQSHRPQVVFHAAAHKHVHFMEAQPAEAIKNNVAATLIVARAARDFGAERFILISTDKAVRPTGVMGASKRAAEMVVGAIGKQAAGAFMSVRFGNVLGSRGSVIPTFRRQIERGGPVTVTHPDVTRYFMTIPEAVSLMIEAGRQGRGGELYLLDMGKPVRIADLARNLITLSGLEPDVDIPIVYTGMRPGEKLTEELLTLEEGAVATENGKIFTVRHEAPDWADIEAWVEGLIASAEALDDEAIRAALKARIPDFGPKPELSDVAPSPSAEPGAGHAH